MKDAHELHSPQPQKGTATMKYATLRRLIEHYETWQRLRLREKMPGGNPNPDLCNGKIQFASIENATPQSKDDHDAPIVVGIGINYDQEFVRYAAHTPRLPDKSFGVPGVEDASPDMRAVLDETFEAYESNPKLWIDRHLAPYLPTGIIPPAPRNYLLVATNCTPFVTFKPWQDYDGYPADRAHVLAALDGQMQHLDDLLAILGKEVLWVGHGLGSEALALFRAWQQRNSVPHWLLTANLSGLSRGKIRAASGKTRFWQRERPEVPPFTKEDMLLGPIDE